MEIFFPWMGIVVLILIFLTLDLGVFNRIPHIISMREALVASLIWVILSLGFNLLVWYGKGGEAALAFFTGYLLEKLLSLDNMFVFVVVFNFFGIAPRHQHRILFWGVLGAIIFRLLFILLGLKLIEAFDWILYVFGVLLIYSSFKIYQEQNKAIDIKTNGFIQWVQQWIPLRENYKGRHFFLKIKGKWVATPAFLVLLTIEASDIVFALDSIPAIFSITLDPFIVFTSNIFAILGLRSLYFLLSNVIARFYYLQKALAIILGFVGIKLLLVDFYKIPLWFSFSVIALTLIGAILASFWKDKMRKNKL